MNYSFISLISNTNKVVPFIILGIYALCMVAIAYYSRKKTKTLDDFFLAGRGLGGWMTAFAYGTTYFSAVVFIGYAGELGRAFGLSTLWIGIGNALIGSLLAWIVLGRRTRTMTHTLGVKTMPEFFEKRYNDSKIKLVSAIVIFVFLIPYSASVYQGLSYLFEMVFGLPFIYGVIIIAVLTAMYLFFGGYLATAMSDFLQGIIMLVGVAVMVGVFIGKIDSASFAELAEQVGFIPSTSIPEGGKLWDSAAFNVIVLCLLTSVGIWGLPQSVHKFYAVKDNAAIKKATVVSTVFALIIGCGAYFVGSLSPLFVSDERFTGELGGNFDKIVPDMLTNNLPAALLGLIVVLVLSASMSTLSSLSLSGASSISMDVYKGYVNKEADEKKVGLLMKIMCLFFVACSGIFAVLQIEAIVALMGLSWGTLAGCFIGPYVYGLYSKKANKYGCWVSIIGTLVITFVLVGIFGAIATPEGTAFGDVVKAGIGKSPLIGVICMAFSLMVTPIVNVVASKYIEIDCEDMFTNISKI